jgi:hypothetical protein
VKLFHLIKRMFNQDSSEKKQAKLRERLDFAMSQTKEY